MNMDTAPANPELGRSIDAAGIRTNFHDVGQGFPVMLIHGSGPGVSAWANWRLTLPRLAARARVLAPDMVGFGYTERPDHITYGMETWVQHALGFLDALGITQATWWVTPLVARWPWPWPSAIPRECAVWC